ncbi:MAG: hypothetical protein B7Y25_07285 [Alphaproteobacteria bacterium 16-39-46]|nr:MAG: hypothetical protein B7Y25_07285 [Alphaproteobacteria bacterium 16-39-46]OZA41765.1 MAG: hypothetical protein B7X84_07415 [Alphaproteobacteria bacterium 17-39-52]HQS84712.1 hypothetical protein [Alphaproteobacteria bacterium]HQS94533.1 hypothetical protein [Alphaproteobacteria bacterium]
MKLKTLGLLSASFVVAQLMTMNAMAGSEKAMDQILPAKNMTMKSYESDGSPEGLRALAVHGSLQTRSSAFVVRHAVEDHIRTTVDTDKSYTPAEANTHAEIAQTIKERIHAKQDEVHALVTSIAKEEKGQAPAALPEARSDIVMGESKEGDHAGIHELNTTTLRRNHQIVGAVEDLKGTASKDKYIKLHHTMKELHEGQKDLYHKHMKPHHNAKHIEAHEALVAEIKG